MLRRCRSCSPVSNTRDFHTVITYCPSDCRKPCCCASTRRCRTVSQPRTCYYPHIKRQFDLPVDSSHFIKNSLSSRCGRYCNDCKTSSPFVRHRISSLTRCLQYPKCETWCGPCCYHGNDEGLSEDCHPCCGGGKVCPIEDCWSPPLHCARCIPMRSYCSPGQACFPRNTRCDPWYPWSSRRCPTNLSPCDIEKDSERCDYFTSSHKWCPESCDPCSPCTRRSRRMRRCSSPYSWDMPCHPRKCLSPTDFVTKYPLASRRESSTKSRSRYSSLSPCDGIGYKRSSLSPCDRPRYRHSCEPCSPRRRVSPYDMPCGGTRTCYSPCKPKKCYSPCEEGPCWSGRRSSPYSPGRSRRCSFSPCDPCSPKRYSPCEPSTTSVKRYSPCKECREEPCASVLPCEMTEIGSPCEGGDRGPSAWFINKSRRLGKCDSSFQPHFCPWEADVTVNGTVRGHCNSTAVEVARRMTGRFSSRGERYTVDTRGNYEPINYDSQRMSLGTLDDGTQLHFCRNQREPSQLCLADLSENRCETRDGEVGDTSTNHISRQKASMSEDEKRDNARSSRGDSTTRRASKGAYIKQKEKEKRPQRFLKVRAAHTAEGNLKDDSGGDEQSDSGPADDQSDYNTADEGNNNGHNSDRDETWQFRKFLNSRRYSRLRRIKEAAAMGCHDNRSSSHPSQTTPSTDSCLEISLGSRPLGDRHTHKERVKFNSIVSRNKSSKHGKEKFQKSPKPRRCFERDSSRLESCHRSTSIDSRHRNVEGSIKLYRSDQETEDKRGEFKQERASRFGNEMEKDASGRRMKSCLSRERPARAKDKKRSVRYDDENNVNRLPYFCR